MRPSHRLACIHGGVIQLSRQLTEKIDFVSYHVNILIAAQCFPVPIGHRWVLKQISLISGLFFHDLDSSIQHGQQDQWLMWYHTRLSGVLNKLAQQSYNICLGLCSRRHVSARWWDRGRIKLQSVWESCHHRQTEIYFQTKKYNCQTDNHTVSPEQNYWRSLNVSLLHSISQDQKVPPQHTQNPTVGHWVSSVCVFRSLQPSSSHTNMYPLHCLHSKHKWDFQF